MAYISNIDTLYASVLVDNYMVVASELVKDLHALLERRFFTRSRTVEFIELGGINFKVINGAYSWSYGLECNDFKLYLAHEANKANYPLYVEFRQSYLWQDGYRRAWERFLVFLQRCGFHYLRSKVSRADLACHTDLPILKDEYFEFIHYDPRCEHQDDFGDIEFRPEDTIALVERWGRGETYTGIRVGRGKPLMARIYDKSLEITKSGKQWYIPIWQQAGLDTTRPIINIEFEIKRDWFRLRKIDSVEELFEQLGSIWFYLTQNYLSFRLKDNERRSRRTFCPWWQEIRVAAFNFEGCLLARRREAELNIDRALVGAMGYITSYCAALGYDHLNGKVMAHLYKKLNEMALARGINLDQKIQVKKQRKLAPVDLDKLFSEYDFNPGATEANGY